MDKQDNFLVNKFLKQISKIIDHKLEKLTTVESAIVDQINIDGSVNLHIPPDSTIFTGIQNQSIYQNLKVGDCVKVLKQNNKASNMWIIGGHNLKRDDTVEKINETVSNITDFIIEQGTSGIWTYRKWNSGIAECWGKGKVPVICNIPSGSVYFSDNKGITLPSGLFTQAIIGNVVCVDPWSWTANISVNTSYIYFKIVRGSLYNTEYSPDLQLSVVGKWK